MKPIPDNTTIWVNCIPQMWYNDYKADFGWAIRPVLIAYITIPDMEFTLNFLVIFRR